MLLALASLLGLGLGDPTASAQTTPFVCDGEAYIVQGGSGQLFRVDQSTDPFSFTTVGGTAGFEVNALGFRRTDGLLYGWRQQNPSALYTLDANATLTNLGLPAPLPNGANLNGGDISPDGSTWYIGMDGDGTLYQVALPALTVTTVTITGDNGDVLDIAAHPTNGLLYGADNTDGGQLAVIDPVTGVRTDFDVPGLPTGNAFGGAWFDAAGQFFAYRNNGVIYEIDVSGPTIVSVQTGGPSSTLNDGAACIADQIGAAKQMIPSGPTLPATIDINYAVENFNPLETISNLSAIEDLTAVFGTLGVDWTFTSISSVPASFANPAFDGSADTELINQAPSQSLTAGASATATVQIQLLTDNAANSNGEVINQITVTGENPAGVRFGDVSTDATDPDPNGDGIPAEREPAVLSFAPIAVAKQQTGITPNGSFFDVEFTLILENIGSVSVTNMDLFDDVVTQFGSAFVGLAIAPVITASTATDDPVVSTSWPTTVIDIFTGNSSQLDPGQSVTVVYTLTLDPNAAGAPSPLTNQATFEANAPGGTVDDESDSGADPNSTNPGEPGDTGGFDDPTPVQFPAIGVAKAAPTVTPNGANFDVTFRVVVENIGPLTLDNLTLVDDVAAQFGSAFIGVAVAPAITASTATTDPGLNGTWPAPTDIFDGISGQLDPAQSITVEFTVTLDPNAAGAPSPIDNQATGGGDDPAGNPVSDLSDSGTDPNGANPGEPGDTGGSDDPTPVTFPSTSNPAVGVAKTVTGVTPNGANFDVAFSLVTENTGNVSLDNLTLVDDVAAQFGSAFVSVAVAPAIGASTATTDPTLGVFPPNLFDGASGQLDPGQSITVTFTVTVDPNAAGAPSPLLNQVTGGGDDPGGTPVTDDSDSGTDPAGTNPGEPGDTGGPDDPTPIAFPPTQPPFVCDGEAYVIQEAMAQLIRIDQATDPFGFVPIGGTSPFTINNIGFRKTDGLIYGFRNDAPLEIVSIDATGTVAGLGLPAGLVAGPGVCCNAGDVTPDGNTMYLTGSGPGNPLYRVDLPALTFTSVAITGGGGSSGIADWAVHPASGLLYGGDRINGGLAVLDPTTGIRTNVAVPTLPTDLPGYGGAWFDAAGTLFLYHNNGFIVEIDVSGPTILSTQTGGPNSTQNDAAACINDLIGVAKDMTALTPGLPTTVEIDYAFENFSATETIFNLSALDDLAAVFGTAGVDWTFTSISAAPAGFANPGFDGSADTELINQAPNQSLAPLGSATITVQIQLLTTAAANIDGEFVNQVEVTGENAAGVKFGDLSTSGADPDPNGDDAPGERDPTVLSISAVGVAKQQTAVVPNGSFFDVTFSLVLENIGAASLDNLTLVDDVVAQFGSAFIGVAVAPAITASTATTDPGLNGTWPTPADLFDGTSGLLDAGQSISVAFTVTLDPNAVGAPTVLLNQAVGGGDDPGGNPVTDDSDSGTDPGGTNPGEPGDTGGPNDPTPVDIPVPAIGVAKTVTGITPNDDDFDVTFSLVVENTGAVSLNNLTLVDDVAAQFGSAFVGIAVAPAIGASTATTDPTLGTFPPNVFDGASGQLDPGQSITVTFTVTVDPNAAGAPSPLLNQATAGGDDPGGNRVTDDSDSGTDPAGNNPGEPGDTGGSNDPTPIELPDVGVAKTVSGLTPNGADFDVEFTVAVENTGNVSLDNLTLVDDVATQFGTAFVAVAVAPAITASTATTDPTLGAFPPNVFDGASGQLDPGQSITVTFTVTVDPDAAGAPSPLLNQATGGGDDPTGNPVTDDSDSGTDPAGNNPGEPGDTGGSNDPTPLQVPSVGVAKQQTGLTPNGDDFDVEFTLVLQNTGNVTLDNLTLEDDIAAQFGAAFVGVAVAPAITASTATTDPTLGTFPPSVFDGASGQLDPGQSITVTFTVTVDPDAPGAPSPLLNQAVGGGDDPVGNPVTDDSDSGTDPAGSNPGEPGDTGGPNDPTPLEVPDVGVAKTVNRILPNGDDFDVAFTLVMENTGTVPLDNLTLVDDIPAQFGSAFVAIAVAPQVTFSTATADPTLGTFPPNIFDGTSGQLDPGQSISVTFTVTFDPSAPGAPDPLLNQATGGGTDPTGNPVTDDSDSGTDPAGTNPGEPGDTGGSNDPTPVQAPRVGVAKQQTGVTPNGDDFDVEFTLVMENTGNVTLDNLTLVDNVGAQFGPAFVGVAVAPAIIASTATVDPGLGSFPRQIFEGTSGQLDPGQSITVTFTVTVDPDAPGAPSPLLNQATGGGSDPAGNPVTDDSDSGTDPAGNNPGEPGDTGGSNDPTPVQIPDIGTAKQVLGVGSNDDGTFDVEYEIVVANTGNVPLTNLTLDDDLPAQLGPAYLAVVEGPTIVASNATVDPMLGIFPPQVFDGVSGQLDPGQTLAVTFVVRIDPGTPIPTLENQATAGGTDPSGGLVSDLSDGGVDPTGSNPGEPGDTGGSNDPTVIPLSLFPILEIPTLGQWGLALLVLLIASLALGLLRRQRLAGRS